MPSKSGLCYAPLSAEVEAIPLKKSEAIPLKTGGRYLLKK
jgi:hypothetical protein